MAHAELDLSSGIEKIGRFNLYWSFVHFQGTQSLGIMIIEGRHAEVGQGIFISDIQEGSAAEQVIFLSDCV